MEKLEMKMYYAEQHMMLFTACLDSQEFCV